MKSILKKTTLILLVFFLMGCAWETPRQVKGPRGQGMLTGTVIFSGVPCAPGMGTVPPCDGPYPDYEVIVYKKDGKTVAAKTRTDKDGRFSISLSEGDYLLYSKKFRTMERKSLDAPHTVIIRQGKTEHLDMIIDTGIK
jgi:hypothetical protein